ncbi:unnamed protein product [Ranitomeya imitator]|uniref:Vascular endothelial growth factor heparin-binding domain-containing protein n=1 Tax=Ranitomeya imitator TaxID=111125 RepID=A0ABN9LSF3_9NEOB|nr:unnamed protein product [Ranitomeya imitator]
MRPHLSQLYVEKSFQQHSRCECRQKKEIKGKQEKKAKQGKGHKRKRKKIRYKSHRFHCEPCTDTERRKHLFIQDPQTCKCSCKNTDSRCKTKQLELNERTCSTQEAKKQNKIRSKVKEAPLRCSGVLQLQNSILHQTFPVPSADRLIEGSETNRCQRLARDGVIAHRAQFLPWRNFIFWHLLSAVWTKIKEVTREECFQTAIATFTGAGGELLGMEGGTEDITCHDEASSCPSPFCSDIGVCWIWRLWDQKDSPSHASFSRVETGRLKVLEMHHRSGAIYPLDEGSHLACGEGPLLTIAACPDLFLVSAACSVEPMI